MEENTKKHVGLLGFGAWGKNLARNFYDLGVLNCICEIDTNTRNLCRKQYAQMNLWADPTEIWSNSEISGVVIATPAETHGHLVKMALQAGKDVFVEKPLCLSVAEGTELVRLAHERQRILMVGHVLEYHPGIRRLLNLVETGELGDVRYVYSNRLSLGKVRREENILWSFAPHDVAVLLRLLKSMPEQVVACGGSYLQPHIADMTVTHLLFPSGVRAHIFVSWLHPFKEQRFVVIGSKRMASFDDVSKELVLHDQRVDWQQGMPVPIKGAGEKIHFEVEEPLRLECLAFLHAIESKKPPLTDGPSGLRVLQVLEAAEWSLAHDGQPIRL